MTGISPSGERVDVSRRPIKARRPCAVELAKVRLALVEVLTGSVGLSERQAAAVLNTNQTEIHRLRRRLEAMGSPSLSLFAAARVG